MEIAPSDSYVWEFNFRCYDKRYEQVKNTLSQK